MRRLFHYLPRLSLLLLLALTLYLGSRQTDSNLPREIVDQVPPAPETMAGTAPGTPDLVVERYAMIAAPRACLYNILSDVEQWQDWNVGTGVAWWGDGLDASPGHTFYQTAAGTPRKGLMMDAEPSRFLRWLAQDAEGGGVIGVLSYRLLDGPRGQTIVINREEYHKWYVRPLGRLLSRSVGYRMDESLAGLARQAQQTCQPPGSPATVNATQASGAPAHHQPHSKASM